MLTKLAKILELDYVNGCLLISHDGQIHYSHFLASMPKDPTQFQWRDFIKTLDGIKEADILFENTRLYLQRAPIGYLIVLMENFADVAMIRLQCEVLVPTLKPQAAKGLRRLFSKNRH